MERVKYARAVLRLLLVAHVAAWSACTGTIDDVGAGRNPNRAPGGGNDPASGQAGAGASHGSSGSGAGAGGSGGAGPNGQLGPSFEPPAPELRRLTRAQYTSSVHALLGDVTLATELESDALIHGSASVGTAHATLSPRATEQYENAAYELAAQAILPERRATLVDCEPSALIDTECTESFVRTFGRKTFRRALEEEEVTRYVALAEHAAMELNDFWSGIELAVAGMLQSPHFLFRAELGEVDPALPDRLRYTGYDMASRLSFLFWDSMPDEELLQAAEAGELLTLAGVRVQAERLAQDARAHAALATFHSERLGLEELDALSKDATLFPEVDDALIASMREDILRTIEAVTLRDGGDYRDLFDTRVAFVDRRLAELYGLPTDGLGDALTEVELPSDSPRIGLLGKAAFLSMMAHARATSPTRRGKFVRERILCQTIQPPPPGVNTVLPEPNPDAPTMRERLKTHAVDQACKGCHLQTDPIGLAFEHFDAIGAFRPDDNGHALDVTGELDGEAFEDARDLALLVRERPEAAECLVRQLYRYAGAHVETAGETVVIDDLTAKFTASGYSVAELLIEVATSDGFRFAGAGEQP